MRAEDVGDVEVLQRHLRQGWAGRIWVASQGSDHFAFPLI